MKNLKGAFTVLTAVSLMVFLTSCCCFRCHKPKPTCVNLIQDGSFETSGCTTACGFNTGNTFDGVWKVISAPSPDGVDVVGNPYDATQFYPAPDGTEILVLNFLMSTASKIVSQDITTSLKAGKIYSLSFFQSAFVFTKPGYGAVPGDVNVQLVSTVSGTIVFDQSFHVNKGTGWVLKTAPIHITTAGNYTIKFSSLSSTSTSENPHGYSAANIDAVSLCEKNP